MDSLKVKILSRKLIKPSIPTPNDVRFLKISLFDQLAPPVYVHILFYYLQGDDADYNSAKNDEKWARMEQSLSQVLTKYYPLAGRFVKDDLLIDCGDQGVEYFEARVNGKLAVFLQERSEIELLNKFLPGDVLPSVLSVTSPLLVIQINKFDCGGVVLGIRISHIVADACTMMAFAKEWANKCCTGLMEMINNVVSPGNYDLIVSLFPTRSTIAGRRPPTSSKNPAKIVTRRFLFDEIIIGKVKQITVSSSSTNFHPSRNVVVIAMLWKALMGVSIAQHGYLRDSIISIAMNLRGKTATLSMSEVNYGNFWLSVIVPFKAKTDKMELVELMILLKNSIKSMSEKLATASADDISTMLINCRNEMFEKRFLHDGVDVYVCTSWCRFPIYEVDFGWGKPHWVSQISKPFEGIVLLDTKNGDGVEAWVSLQENYMIEFERQLEILVSESKL
ncbi:hypothetical protein ACH5RR_022413 [Cinchona calisaya]|uniref:Uncharacterized protein n=1 Tax=Cinchona calisaya TaxID=153742 RepID=A0ABD2Z7Q1_9GENT